MSATPSRDAPVTLTTILVKVGQNPVPVACVRAGAGHPVRWQSAPKEVRAILRRHRTSSPSVLVGSARRSARLPTLGAGRVVLIGLAMVSLALGAAPARAAGASSATSDADREFIANVHLVTLWETTAGEMAVKKGSTEQLREAAQQLTDQYTELGRLNTAAARTLGVALPVRPTETERRWLDDLENASGPAFDDLYVMLLRGTDGRMFPQLGVTRAMTASPVVRTLTQKANDIVLEHIDTLENTGLVQFQQLPPAGSPAGGAVVPKTRRSAHGGAGMPIIWLILAFGAIGLGVAGGRVLRPTTFGGRDIGRRDSRRPVRREPARLY